MERFITNTIRTIIWLFGYVFLFFADILYELNMNIAKINFFSGDGVWRLWTIMMLFVGAFIIIRMFSIFFKLSLDEEYQDKFKPSKIFTKLIAISFIIVLLPWGIKTLSNISTFAITNMNLWVGVDDTKPSTLLISSFMAKDENTIIYGVGGELIEYEPVQYTLEDMNMSNINKREGDTYKFVDDLADLFILTVLGLVMSILIILNAVQIGQRTWGLVFKLLIAPIPISNMIDPDDETFTMWRKMIVSDYLLNFFQTYMLIVVMLLSSSPAVSKYGMWAKIIMIVAGFLMLLKGIPELARLLGGEVSQGGVLQQVANLRMATRGVGSALKKGAGAVAGGIATGGAALQYGAGRLAGGIDAGTVSDMKNLQEKMIQNSAFDNATKMNGDISTSQNNNQVSAPQSNSTSDQSRVKNDENINQYQNIDAQSSLNENSSNMTGVDTQLNNGQSSNKNESQKNNSNGQNNLFNAVTDAKTNAPKMELTKPGSPAQKFATTFANKGGLTGAVGRFATATGKHMYQGSVNRLNKSSIFNAGSKATQSIKEMQRKGNPTNKRDFTGTEGDK